MSSRFLILLLAFGSVCSGARATTASDRTPAKAVEIAPLQIEGNHFESADGSIVRFWGVNLAAMYPTHAEAEAIAANLAGREINLARLHHVMRESRDWNPTSGIPALVTYRNDSRTPDPAAWDRFDYFNAQLRKHGIYLLLSLHSSRRFLAGDVDILTTNSSDRTAWMAAMQAVKRIPRSIDLFKSLPMVDERCARLMEEFTRRLLTHVNPYTGIAYGQDPQVLYIETVNEHSLEYFVICQNRFDRPSAPAGGYFTAELQSKWKTYLSARGVSVCDLYAPTTVGQKLARGDFLRGLDAAYGARMKALVRGLGCRTPVEYSNLWRGEAFQKFEEAVSDVVEDHSYCDPFIVRKAGDFLEPLSRSTPAGKPFFVGELNQTEADRAVSANAAYRTMLPVAATSYGDFNDWSGIVWFAWNHGDRYLGADGWSRQEQRRPAVNSDMIGSIMSDGMMLDHLRTAGMIFRRGLVAPSRAPVVIAADEPLDASNYATLMAPKYPIQPGWQNIHAMKRAFGPVASAQRTAEWMNTAPASPLVSDTGEIRKDIVRHQLTVSAPQAEEFSGEVDAQAPAGLVHLQALTGSGFATVIVVSADDEPLGASQHLVISRTWLDDQHRERANPTTALVGLRAPCNGNTWHLRQTRPRGKPGREPVSAANGALVLPADGWHEAELEYGRP